jgi:senataxin
VAITRAKCSLFLLGKSSTLLANPLWRALITDAKDRNLFKPYTDKFWQPPMKQINGKTLRNVTNHP